jgi:two-component system cell cycle response regulator
VRIRKSIRGIDLACRYGGEEFVIMMPETDLAVANVVAERLRKSIAGEPFSIEKGARKIDVTLSIGIATLDNKGEPALVRLGGGLINPAPLPSPPQSLRSRS